MGELPLGICCVFIACLSTVVAVHGTVRRLHQAASMVAQPTQPPGHRPNRTVRAHVHCFFPADFFACHGRSTVPSLPSVHQRLILAGLFLFLLAGADP